MFTNVELNQPSFTVFTSNGQREIQLEQMRKQLAVLLARESLQATTISKNSDLKSEMQKTENELREVRNFIDLLLAALADAIPNDDTPAATIASYKSDATSARTSLTTSLSAVSSALASLETAEKNLEEGVAGAVDADIAATEASVKQAQGAYNAALASLEKTILRSPIAGTLNTFDIKLGDYLQPSQQIALVSNNGALQVIAYIGEKDRPNVSPGDAAIIEGKYPGTVTKIAPALDPVTRRIEMRIGLSPEAATHLTNGQSVRIAFPRKETAASSEDILIPITALKLETDRIVAFKVENGRIVALPITIGTISGSMVRVEEGLALDTEIVADARGLKEGDEVEISIAE
jgi:multidrug resistance efflux pump